MAGVDVLIAEDSRIQAKILQKSFFQTIYLPRMLD